MLTVSAWPENSQDQESRQKELERKQGIKIIYWEILGMKRSFKKNISFSISSAVQELPGRVKSHCRWVIILIDTVNGTIKLEKIIWQLR